MVEHSFGLTRCGLLLAAVATTTMALLVRGFVTRTAVATSWAARTGSAAAGGGAGAGGSAGAGCASRVSTAHQLNAAWSRWSSASASTHVQPRSACATMAVSVAAQGGHRRFFAPACSGVAIGGTRVCGSGLGNVSLTRSFGSSGAQVGGAVTAADHRLLSTGVLFGQPRSYGTQAVGVPRASAGSLQRGPAVVGGVGVVQRRHATAKNRRKMQKASEFFARFQQQHSRVCPCAARVPR
jgi:hypothetical protein